MGYDVHITRKKNWFDEDQENEISLSEWKDYVSSDPEMRLDNKAEFTMPSGEVLNMQAEGICVWIAYSGENKNQNHAWFTHNNGKITVKNPDEEILEKMQKIAVAFNAKVQGDEGEYYNFIDSRTHKVKKPWWKFW